MIWAINFPMFEQVSLLFIILIENNENNISESRKNHAIYKTIKSTNQT